jgi:tape measure domain-containing protein
VSERIEIVVTDNGTARQVKRNIEDIGKGATGTASSIKMLKGALAGLAASALLRETIQIANAYGNLQNRLRTVTNSQAELTATQARLLEISNRTRASFTDTVEAYSRTAVAAQQLGVSQEEVLQFTELLNMSIAMSGASAQEAAAGTRQLTQALASGRLSGDELRAVLEQLPTVADVIAKQMRVTRGDLRALGAEGKITGKDILDAFKNADSEIRENFAETVPTVAQGWNVFMNGVIQGVGNLDEATGASSRLATVLQDLGELLPELGTRLGNFSKSLFDTMDESHAQWADIFARVEEYWNHLMRGTRLSEEMQHTNWNRLMASRQRANTTSSTPFFEAFPSGTGDEFFEQFPWTRDVSTSNKRKRKETTFNDVMNELRQQQQLLQIEDLKEREIADQVSQLERSLTTQKAFTATQREQIENLVRHNQMLRERDELEAQSNARIDEALQLELEAMEVERRVINARSAGLGSQESFRMNDPNSGIAASMAAAQGFGDHFSAEVDKAMAAVRSFGTEAGAIFANVFGPNGSVVRGIGNVVAQTIVFRDNFLDGVRNMARAIASQLISSLVQLGINMMIVGAIGKAQAAGAIATTTAGAGIATAAWAGPAFLANTATLGAAAGTSTATLGTGLATAKGMALASQVAGFAEGGWTGDMPADQVAGVVHGREFVVNAQAAAANRPLLEAINSGKGGMTVNVVRSDGVDIQVRQISPTDVEIIARRIMQSEVPDLVAADIDESGKVGRAVSRNSTAPRKYS